VITLGLPYSKNTFLSFFTVILRFLDVGRYAGGGEGAFFSKKTPSPPAIIYNPYAFPHK
jgi:hypothetical protein